MAETLDQRVEASVLGPPDAALDEVTGDVHVERVDDAQAQVAGEEEIGRASCRERV